MLKWGLYNCFVNELLRIHLEVLIFSLALYAIIYQLGPRNISMYKCIPLVVFLSY